MSEKKFIRTEGMEIIFYLFWGIFTALGLPIIAGFILKGFSESFVSGTALLFGAYLTNFLIYIPFLIISLFIVIFPIAKILTLKENQNPATAPNANWFRIFTASYIYEPEQMGLLWRLSEDVGLKGKRNFMRWSLNPLRILVVSILIFGIYGMFIVTNPQLAVSGVPQMTLQQFTPTSEVIFSAFVPAFAENGFLMFLFMILMGINAYLIAKTKSKNIYLFFAFGFLICILMGFTWGGLHTLVYGNNDASLFATIIFGFVGSLITLLTGIFIFWNVWHISNNMFITLSKIITLKSDILIVTGLILFIILIAWIGIEIAVRKSKNKVEFN